MNDLQELTFSQEEMRAHCYDLFNHYRNLSPEDLYNRFLQVVSPDVIKDKLRAIYADSQNQHFFFVFRNKEGEMIGVSQLSVNLETRIGEYALSVIDPYKKQGIGTDMVRRLLEIAKEKNCKQVEGYISYGNFPSRLLASALGAKILNKEDWGLLLAIFTLS